MLNKISYLVMLIAVLIFVGCDNQSVLPLNSGLNKINGETKLLKSISAGTVKHLENGNVQVRNKIMVFEDIADNNELSGLRNIVFNHNYDENNQGYCYGTFSIETDSGLWEGDWRGTTTSNGTVINAMGYSLDERDKFCEWKYTFSNLEGSQRGIFSAEIFFDDRDEQF